MVVGDPRQHNAYQYANNSPLTNWDPTGEALEECASGMYTCSNRGTEVTGFGKNYEKEVTSNGGTLSPEWVEQQDRNENACRKDPGCRGTSSQGPPPPPKPVYVQTNSGYPAQGVPQGSPGDPGLDSHTAEIPDLPCPAGESQDQCDRRSAYNKTMQLFGSRSGMRAGTGAAAGAKGRSSGSKPPGCKCFLAGTDVLMADGTTKNIEDIRLGDKVKATDPETGETGDREVTHLIVTEDDKHFNTLSIATEDGIEELTATHEHPFWSPSANTWVEARELTPGSTLLTDQSKTVIVTANKPYTQHARTYNLTIDDLHTYYVLAGETPVLVHNANCGFKTGVADEKYDKHVLGLDDSGNPTRTPDMPEYDTPDGSGAFQSPGDHVSPQAAAV